MMGTPGVGDARAAAGVVRVAMMRISGLARIGRSRIASKIKRVRRPFRAFGLYFFRFLFPEPEHGVMA